MKERFSFFEKEKEGNIKMLSNCVYLAKYLGG